MKYYADLHIHSHFSLATSKQLCPEYLEQWAYLKGLRVIGTGDFTHPGWLKELKSKFTPAEPGLFKLKDDYRKENFLSRELFGQSEVRFILSAEISNIYKRDGKTRKVHNIILVPDLETAEKIQSAIINKGGNIRSDGRPILGMDSRDLLDLCLNASPDIIFIPAHIWTPWFSALGSKSGFDDLDQCYGSLVSHIHAVETGLSSDAPMNWACSFLDKFTLVSNSDAHSPEKLGRNANIFDTDLSYYAIKQALASGDPKACRGTVHLFPQEGKYFNDGHRKCGICWDPLLTLKNREICPVCGKKVVVGVLNRVAQLSDRKDVLSRPGRLPFYSIIPLPEIIADIEGVSSSSKKVSGIYKNLLQKFGPELNILIDSDPKELRIGEYPLLGEAVERMRNRKVIIKEGCDGEYGKISIFTQEEINSLRSPSHLFGSDTAAGSLPSRPLLSFDLQEYQDQRKLSDLDCDCEKGNCSTENITDTCAIIPPHLYGLNFLQRQAADHFEGPCLVLAGPGTGKTRTLTARIAELVLTKKIPSENIYAITFTNKAAGEIRQRLEKILSCRNKDLQLNVLTFHSLGLSILREYHCDFGRKMGFNIISENDRKFILNHYLRASVRETEELLKIIYDQKFGRCEPEKDDIVERYEIIMKELNLFDYEDLIRLPLVLLNSNEHARNELRKKCRFLLIDEYQDIDTLQYQFIRALMPDSNSNIYSIGDPNQSIYGFRGSDPGFIDDFRKDYPHAKVIRLQESYRCSDKILKASSDIIKAHADPLKGLHEGIHIKIISQSTDKSEAEYVARTIEKMVGGVRFFSMDSNISGGEQFEGITSLSDFAVLCRTRSLMQYIEKAFHDHAIPYRTYTANKFFDEEPVSILLDCLKFINDTTNVYVEEKLKAKNILPLLYESGLMQAKKQVPSEIVPRVWKLLNSFKEIDMKIETTEKFNALLPQFGTLEALLDYADLGSDPDAVTTGAEHVNVLTIHAAKGLEFESVFVIGCEDGLLPFIRNNETCDLDEERRLLYVAMTRAKKYLFLTHAQKRLKHGKMHVSQVSPFLKDIQKELIKREKENYVRRADPEKQQMKLF
jgi:uncharacterized protein (TIGR00375 family)